MVRLRRKPDTGGDGSDVERFDGIFAAHRGSVLGYLLRRANSREDAADLLSDTFLVAWRRLGDVPEGDAAKAWLIGVARNLLLNHHRQKVRVQNLNGKLSRELSEIGIAPSTETESSDSEILTALGQLPESDRELLTLSAWDDLSPNEIAEALGENRATVRSRLHRARLRLRNELEESSVGSSSVPGSADLKEFR